jgi:hypothetical protein
MFNPQNCFEMKKLFSLAALAVMLCEKKRRTVR